jgi:hypothetical protein
MTVSEFAFIFISLAFIAILITASRSCDMDRIDR